MKVILAQPYLNLMGGVERVILKIAEHYKAKIYTLEYDPRKTYPEFKNLDIKVIGKAVPLSERLPYRASQGLKYGYNFYNMLIKEDYDVINAHISPSEWVRHKNKRVLWYCHTPPREVYDLYATRMQNRSTKEKFVYALMTRGYKLIANRIIRQIEEIATNSSTTNQRIKKYFSRSATVVNPGIDYERYHNNSDSKFFLYPSRILINKRQDYAIDAFKRFVNSTKSKDYRLVIAGTLSLDPEHVAYYQKLKKMSMGFKIAIKTNVSERELAELYSNCTATLFTAINEDYGFIPLESMSSSKPIISVNEGGPRETILDEKTGFLVNSPTEMASKMRFIVEHKSLAEQMGKEGRKRVIKDYSWNAFFKKLDPLLRRVSKNE